MQKPRTNKSADACTDFLLRLIDTVSTVMQMFTLSFEHEGMVKFSPLFLIQLKAGHLRYKNWYVLNIGDRNLKAYKKKRSIIIRYLSEQPQRILLRALQILAD